MPRPLSGIRIARDFITHQGGSTPTVREIDFQLATREAIEIFAVVFELTSIAVVTEEATSLTVNSGAQALHVESENPRDIEQVLADTDITRLDDEIIAMQTYQLVHVEDATNSHGAATLVVTPSELQTFPQPILTAFNMTHTAVTQGSDSDLSGNAVMHYRFVELSDAETVGVFARRR